MQAAGLACGVSHVSLSCMIRPISHPDLEALYRLYRQLNPDDQPPLPATLDTVWQRIERDPDLRYYGFFLAETLVGACNMAIIPNLTRQCQPYGLIENVVTDHAHRGRGIGKQLLAHALDEAWEAGCYKVMLLSGRHDPATLGFYEGAGFDPHSKFGFVARRPAQRTK